MSQDLFLNILGEFAAGIVLFIFGSITGMRLGAELKPKRIFIYVTLGLVFVVFCAAVLVFLSPWRASGTYAVIQGEEVEISVSPIPPTLMFRSEPVLPRSPTPTYTPTPTVTPEPWTPTPTASATPTLTDTPTATATWTETPTSTPPASLSPTATRSPIPSPTPLPPVEIIWRHSECDKPGQSASILQVKIESNDLVIYGVADRPSFTSYVLYWGQDIDQAVEARSRYESTTAVSGLGVLHRIPVKSLKKGIYQLALRVLKDGNYNWCEATMVYR